MILGDDALRDMLIQKGFKRAAAFSWERMAKQVKEIYDQKLETINNIN
jgi:glycosyltransferase involved in cell wall biosynthesis